jgi:transposase
MNGEVLEEAEVKSIVKTQLKKKVPQLLDALNGKIRRHHREMMNEHWEHLEYLEKKIARLEEKIDECVKTYKEITDRIDSVPGIERTSAITIFAEIGPCVAEMFSTDAQFASWAGLCPGNNESAGKRKKAKTMQGNKQLKAALCQVAWANSRSKNRIGQYFRRIRKRRGDKKAIVATAHLIARLLHAMLKNQTDYKEIDVPIGEGTSDRKNLDYYLQRIRHLGYNIQVNEISA